MLSNSVCLNMIVKNESKIIKRMLDSVVSIVDTFCICDTGSTDGTLEIIEAYFQEKKIFGKLLKCDFVNFEHNRNFSLEAASRVMSDYILLLDADMVFEVGTLKKEDIASYDGFHILQGNDEFYYHNCRIIKNIDVCRYIGVTHEYISTPDNFKIKLLKKEQCFIRDYADGGSKEKKVERDLSLLTKGIIEEPQNARYHFYLANTYFDSKNYDDAISYYQRRVLMGDWEQEIWYSYYRIGTCFKCKNNPEKALHYWLLALEILPIRLENIYEIMTHYLSLDNYETANSFYELYLWIDNQSTKLSINRDTFLFYQKDVYEYKFHLMYIQFADKLKFQNNTNISKSFNVLLNYPFKDELISFLFQRLKFFNLTLTSQTTTILTTKLTTKNQERTINLSSSSFCIIPDPYDKGYLINLRYVNYHILKDGNYRENISNDEFNSTKTPVITVNQFIRLNEEFKLKDSKVFKTNIITGDSIAGLEDVRLFHDQKEGKIIFMASSAHSISKIGIVTGVFDVHRDFLEYVEVYHPKYAGVCEKNWVFLDYKEEVHIVYKWFPLTICKRTYHTLEDVLTKQMPLIFKFARGSTSAVKVLNGNVNENWFVVHFVASYRPRHYYHMIVVLDDEMNLLRYSCLFKFSGTPIEYCLGMMVEQNRITMTYSENDNTSKMAFYDKTYIESLMC